MTFVFETLYDKLEDDRGNKLLTIHQYDIHDLMKNMFFDLDKILDIFGCIMPDDVVKTFVIHFWDKDILIKRAEDELDLIDIAYKFDELFGDMIGDTPIESDKLSRAEINKYKEDYLRRANEDGK